jgi:hypothetical protein
MKLEVLKLAMTHNPPPPKLSLLPDNAPFTPEQRAWLDGFFIAALGLADSGITPLSPQEAATIMAGGAQSPTKTTAHRGMTRPCRSLSA